jgi:N-acetyl-gamma-glutamyl-phosphate reductase
LHNQADTGYLTLVVVQDNLVKGAAGQSIQNMIIMFGLPEAAGLQVVPLLP